MLWLTRLLCFSYPFLVLNRHSMDSVKLKKPHGKVCQASHKETFNETVVVGTGEHGSISIHNSHRIVTNTR